MGSAEANKTFPDQKQRAAFCHSVYKDAKNMTSLTVLTAAVQQGTQPRTEELMGREFLVISAVLVQGQVLHNNLGTTLLPPDEITEDWAQEWNGVPVIVHDHPSHRGIPVSARTPEVLNARGVGMVFRAQIDKDAGGTARLKGEVWLEKERAEQVAELAGIMNRLQVGERVELSTGFPVMAIDQVGVFNGESYEKILRPTGADHLAIFVDKAGACSVEDGCGLGVHAKQEESDVSNVNAKEERGIVLRLLDHMFAGVQNTEVTPAVISDTPSDQEKTGNEFRLLIRRLKALEKTNAEIGVACGLCPTTIGRVERGEMLQSADEALAKLKEYAQAQDAGNQDRSDEEHRKLLDEALEASFGGTGKFLWIDATFSEQKRVVFGLVKENPGGVKESLFEVTYELSSADNEITFADPKEVERRVIYEPVANNAANKEGDMGDKDKKAAENKAAEDKAAEDKAAEDKAAEDKAAKDKEAAENKAAGTGDPKPTVEDKKDGAEGAAGKDAKGAQPTAVEALVTLVKEQAEKIDKLEKITKPVVDEMERERQSLVTELTANKAVPFDQAELEAKPLVELQKLHAMSRGENYAGRGGPRVAENVASEQFAEPVSYFEQKEKKEDGE